MIDVDKLTEAQYWGRACIVCAKVFPRGRPGVEVARTGMESHSLHACAEHADAAKGNPAWPALGAA